MTLKLLTSAAVALTATAVSADPGTMALNYEQFEAAVPHIDLENCPASLNQPATFCRATLQHEEIHVFVFSEQGNSPMVGFSSFPADGIATLLK